MSQIKIHPLSRNLVVRCASSSARRNEALERKVDAEWNKEKSRRGDALHNGSVFSVVSHGPTQITGAFDEYRYFVAQMANPELYEDLDMRFLAVSGVIICPDGIVFGRRAHETFQDQGEWELVPSGGLETEDGRGDGTVDLKKAIFRELEEEAGLRKDAIRSVDVLCLLEDQKRHLFDVGIRIEMALSSSEILSFCRKCGNKEYEEFKVICMQEIENFIRSEECNISAVSIALLSVMNSQ